MTKEQKFYKTLQDIFIGAKIEGQGGFVNLMKIKSNYYSKIEKKLKDDIKETLKQYPTFREELFDKLYTFFNRYFTESGSIYFNSTPFHNNIYEKVYTDDKDVILFWKTQMLYYVKTDRIFRSIPVEFDNYRFYFDATTIENKKANEKRSLIYELKEVKEDKTIVFNVYYSEKGRVTKTEDILKELKKSQISIDEEKLERAFRIFEKQSEVDFFINKNAKAFLQEQFKLWSYQYFWEGAKEWTAERVNQIQILKDIAFKIIDFVSQFEDELVKIWNKPKFVKNSNYVITLDRINNLELIEKILNHININEQIKEWQELGIVDDAFETKDVFENDIYGKKLTKKYEHLPIDTKYFKDLELAILSQFDDLDNSLDGWLIKSENYQALNTILPKFKEKVQTIYIDPPFNLDSSDQFLYRTNYKDANWATLLENRIRIAREWLNEKGSIFVRCDYNGNWIVRCLMDEIFGRENFRNEIVISRSMQTRKAENKFLNKTDSLFFYFSNSENGILKILETEKEHIKSYNQTLKVLKKLIDDKIYKDISIKLQETFWMPFLSMPGESKTSKQREIFGIKLIPPSGRHWAFSQENLDKAIKNKTARLKCEKCGAIIVNQNQILNGNCKQCGSNNFEGQIYSLYNQINNNWTDIDGYEQDPNFPTRNSEILLKRVIESTSNEGDLVMDFFLGSGTTIAVAHKLGRKWIGVEMGEHFYSVVLPRIKKVLSYDKSGISKEVKEYQGGGFFKYYELEQYEETLANTVYENHDLLIIKDKSPYEQYVFMKDEKMLRALKIDYENKKVNVDLSKLYENIDIAETLSDLTGKWIKKLKVNEVEFADGSVVNTKNLDYKLIKPLIWWE